MKVTEYTPPIQPTTVTGWMKLLKDENKKLKEALDEFNAEPEEIICKFL